MKKLYGVMFPFHVTEDLQAAAMIVESTGTRSKMRVFELGKEYEVEIKSVVRSIHELAPTPELTDQEGRER